MRHFTIILIVLNFSNCGFSLILCLSFVFLRQKKKSICCFGPRMYFQTGQVFFIPEWLKGEFVSILCWQHSG
jgi:hypothetical protein